MIPPMEESSQEVPSAEHNTPPATFTRRKNVDISYSKEVLTSEKIEELTDIKRLVNLSSYELTPANLHSFVRNLSIQTVKFEGGRLVKVLGKEPEIGKNICLVGTSRKQEHLKWLKNFITNPNLEPFISSVRIFIGTEYVDCCTLILQVHSEVFRQHPYTSSFRFSEEKVTMRAFQIIYDWMIDPSLSIWCSYLVEVLVASSYLRIKELTERCLMYIDENFIEHNAVLLCLEMRIYNFNFFDTTIISRVHKFFLTFVASEDFLTLSVKDVMQLLKLDTIGVNSEIEVFYTAVRWLKHKWKDRMQYTKTIMDTIRFGLISPWNILPIVIGGQPKIIKDILKVPGVYTLLSDAMAFEIAKTEYQRTPVDEIEDVITELVLNGPNERHWIYDNVCSYHHSDDCPQIVKFTVTYKLFDTYLDILCNKPVSHYKSLHDRNHRNMCCDQK